MVTLSSVWGTIAGMGMAALKSFLRTMLLFCGEGLILAVVTYVWLMAGFRVAFDKWALLAAVLALLVLLESILVGAALAGKRAVAMALVHALRVQRLGQTTVRLLFERLLDVSAEQPVGQRGGRIAQAVERVPLAQAERRLSDAARDLVGGQTAGGTKGWVRRRVERVLLRLVQRVTLARFRQADAEHGGVDLTAVCAELEASIDERLIHKLKGGINLWTALAVAFLPVQVAAACYLLVLAGFAR